MNQNIHKPTPFRTIMKIAIPVVIIAAGGVALAYFKNTGPRIKRERPKPRVAVVEVLSARRGQATPTIQAMGTVMASREVTLRARVSGEIQALSDEFAPGGHIAQGETVLELDPADYEVAVQKAKSALEKAQADLAIEQGNQTIAREELRLLSETPSDMVNETDLLLRKPQLRQARATVSSAQAELRQARLNLNRTSVRAPFNALVVQRNVNLGSQVNTQDTLATLVSTDEYWVEAMVPLDRLTALDLNCPARVHSPAGGGTWQGRVIRVTGKLSDQSRMATVIVAIADPLGIGNQSGRPPLILADYVHVEIEGRPLASVIKMPRTALRDGNTVWVYRDGKLEIRTVQPAWKQNSQVYIRDGLSPGDPVIISDLTAPVNGMQLALSGEKDAKQLAMSEAQGGDDAISN